MDRLAIRFMGEWYIQDGFTDLRSNTGERLENEPKFVKATLDEIKQSGGNIQYMQLKSGCTLEEVGFTAPRLSATEYGVKTSFYGISAPAEQHERAKALTDVAKVFADKFKVYAEGTKKRRGKAVRRVKL